MKGKLLSCVQLLGTPWTAAYQAPPSMGFSRQEYWSGVPCLYHHPWGGGVEVRVPRLSLMCPAGVRSPTSGPPGPRGGSPHQNFGEGCCVPRGWSVGDPSASPWEERITWPRVIALPLLHLVEFCCHCPSPHACTPGALCSLGIPRWCSRKESAC